MIEKLNPKMEFVEISVLGNKKAECLDFEAGRKLNLKINELVDAVNTIQKERELERFEIQEWIGILEAVRKSVNKLETMAKNTNTVLESLVQENNFHEMQIDELQMKLEPEKCDIPDSDDAIQEVIHADPYSEQRKWIGCVCRFWDNDDTQEFSYGVLTAIDTDFGVGYSCNGEYEYDNCEPVKPDDDIIYKGDNNE